MYQINDFVLYSLNTICRISDIATYNFAGKEIEYYVLKPVYNETSTIYIPTNNDTLKNKMRSLLSKEEIYQLIYAMPEANSLWIDDEQKRKELFQHIIDQGDRYQLIRLIKTLFLQRQKQMQIKGKSKMHVADERFFKDAEKLLYDEFAFVLGISPQQVVNFISEKLEQKLLDMPSEKAMQA